MRMNAGNWMFLPMPAYPDQYCMGDMLEKDGSALEFMMFFKPWGASWGNEKQDGAMVPPSLDKYEAAIAEGKLPPMGESACRLRRNDSRRYRDGDSRLCI